MARTRGLHTTLTSALLTFALCFGGCPADDKGDVHASQLESRQRNFRHRLKAHELNQLISRTTSIGIQYARAVWRVMDTCSEGTATHSCKQRDHRTDSFNRAILRLNHPNSFDKLITLLICNHDIDPCTAIDAIFGGVPYDWREVEAFMSRTGRGFESSVQAPIEPLVDICSKRRDVPDSEPRRHEVSRSLCKDGKTDIEYDKEEDASHGTLNTSLLREVSSLGAILATSIGGAERRLDPPHPRVTVLTETELTLIAQVVNHAILMTERASDPAPPCVFGFLNLAWWELHQDIPALPNGETVPLLVDTQRKLDALTRQCESSQDDDR